MLRILAITMSRAGWGAARLANPHTIEVEVTVRPNADYGETVKLTQAEVETVERTVIELLLQRSAVAVEYRDVPDPEPEADTVGDNATEEEVG